ncbi:HlyD family efflux transporter periplasmic adaptor subunit [Ancylobacter sp. WKF20]|uniref:HlyD family efflux transporter periplasmic adaptor subunit n=1 Tax=Ancylobacter sp. WKF20 TaxID=3039801 RepID=UPI00243452DE|nr:HlyD family efflux transporter periplasmic adaptor subunit [Ancylobacter sp. WKF20]WGD30997.1 HlyD family efflux transporter periplasmic adaptor subunit [Ancylobacter sp. WKF20]
MLHSLPRDRHGPEAFAESEGWQLLGAEAGTRALSDVTQLRPWLEAWLSLQCALIGDVAAATVTLDAAVGVSVSVFWPPGSRASYPVEAAASVRTRTRGMVKDEAEDGAGAATVLLAFPLMLDGQAFGGVALRLEPRSPEALRLAMRHMQWGVAWLREWQAGGRLDALRAGDSAGRALLDLLAAALEPHGLKASVRSLAIELAERFGCERVSVGIVRGNHATVLAISHSASFGKDMNLVRLIGEAMDEAIDQRALVQVPAPPGSLVASRMHEQLMRGHGAATVLTVPMPLRDGFIGAITLERSGSDAFAAEDVRLIDLLATALAPIIEEKRLNDRPLAVKAWDALLAEIGRFTGPRHALRKAFAAGAVLLLLLFTFWYGSYRATADALIEGRVQRAMTAGFDGFLREAPVRAGDQVREGDELARLDDRELVLERLRWATERQRLAFEYERALGERNRSELRLLTNQIEQADAQIQLIDAQIQRARITAPFDGLIVSGDHSQSIGAAVQRGQVLFEVIPDGGYRIVLHVDETQLGELRPGQKGELVLAALPGETFPLTLARITSVAEAAEGRNRFRVEATPDGATQELRPGMRGVAKIEVGERRVIWIWLRSAIDWMRLALWRWIP